MKLLLTSTGLASPKIKVTFLSLLPKNPKEIKVAFVPTASRTEEELSYVQESEDELVTIGIQKENITEINLDYIVTYEEIKDCDLMYVCGGNTFYLTKKIRETGFDKTMEMFIRANKLYIGVSAGSIIPTPSINAAFIEPADENDVGLRDFRGLGWVDFEVSPHVPEIVSYENTEKYSKTTRNKVYAIDHNSGILIQDGMAIIVGDGVSRCYN